MKITKILNPGNKTASSTGQNQSRAIKNSIALDYPLENETITSRDYSFRMTAEGDIKSVMAFIDSGNNGQTCREAVGHWWYDWSGYQDGDHNVRIEARTGSGKKLVTETRSFRVAFRE